MPTPAVNIDTIRNSTVSVSQVRYLAPPTSTTAPSIDYRWTKIRPASVSTAPPRPGNLRALTNWSHTWRRISVTGSTVFYNDLRPFSGWVISSEYGTGAGWWNSVSIPLTSSVPGWLQSACEIKCLSKLQDQDVDFGVFLAESGEFAHTISTTMTRIAKDVRGFRTRWPKSWKRVLAYDRRVKGGKHRTFVSELPSQWLGMVYGWIPSMQDCYGSMAALDKRARTRNYDVRVIGRKSTAVQGQIISFGGADNACSLLVQVDYVASGQVELWFKLRSEALALMSSLGLINPGLIVWERLPYSFVVDWFVPISGWINSLSAAAGYDFVAGCYSKTLRSKSINRLRIQETDSRFHARDFEKYTPQSTLGSFSRSLYSSTPVPGLYLKNPLSVVHVANALALLRNAFRP